MTIYDALRRLKVDEATKLPNWGGYIKKTDPAAVGATGYDLVFKKRNGTEKSYNVSSLGVITTAAAETLDVELLGGIMSNEWEIDTITAYESARAGSGVW